MADVQVMNTQGIKVADLSLADTVFNIPVKPSVMHDVVRMQRAKQRGGNAAVKHRSDVKGSTHKLFRQKGTGRARRGNAKSPLLRGGGVAFGPDPRSYAFKLPKKVRRLGLKMALSAKFQAEELMVLDKVELEQVKTKDFVQILKNIKADHVLLVLDEADEKIELSSRNLPHVKVVRSEGINVYDILKYKHLVLLESSAKAIEGRLI